MPERRDGDEARYERVRRELIERGYLAGPLERFVLRDVAAGAGPLGRLLRPALRGALIGGPLLGLLAALAVAGSQRPLLGAADLPLLWLYFSVPAALALVAVELLAAGVVTALAGRRGARRGDALRAALLAALPVLAWLLTLWWSGRGKLAPVEDAVYLALAVAATLLAGWLAGLVSVSGIVGRTGSVPDRRRFALPVVVVLLALALAVWTLRESLPDGRAAEAPPEFAIADVQGGALFVVGIDGLDAALVAALATGGELGRLMATFESGAVWPLARAGGAEPAEIWTSLLTGFSAERHGVRRAGSERLPGVATPLDGADGTLPLLATLRLLLPTDTVPTSGAARRVPTLWEIVALRRPAAAVGFWATWPAELPEDGAGYVVSDRALPKLLSGGAADRDTFPASLFARLEADFTARRPQLEARFEQLFTAIDDPALRALAHDSYLIDAWNFETARELAADPALRATFVYLPGLEILGQRLGAADPAASAGRAVVTAQALAAYAAFLDELIGAVADEGGRLVILADPGRRARAGERTEGFVAYRGSGARPACVGTPLATADVAPLVLRLVGYPTSTEMSGAAPADCLDLPPAVGQVEGFGTRRLDSAAVESPYDPEMLERLRSLGYLN